MIEYIEINYKGYLILVVQRIHQIVLVYNSSLPVPGKFRIYRPLVRWSDAMSWVPIANRCYTQVLINNS